MRGSDASVDAVQPIWIEPGVVLAPVGVPGVVGGVVSPGVPPSPTASSRTTWSKLIVKVLAAVSPIWMRPTGVVPVFATQSLTISVPSRKRSQVVLEPTVPQSSMLCHPVPSATFELIVVLPKSERSCRFPLVKTTALMTGPPAAVRRRNRSAAPEARFRFTLMHGVIVVVARLR